MQNSLFKFMFPAKKARRIDMFKYTSKEDSRLTGVYHDKEHQCAVASDGHILVASKQMYDSSIGELEGYNVQMKDGSIFTSDCRYPNYRMVLDNIKKGLKKYKYEKYALNADDVRNMARAMKDDRKKLGNGRLDDKYWMVCIGSSTFRWSFIDRFSKVCDSILVFDDADKPAACFTDEVEACLMPHIKNRKSMEESSYRIVGQFGEMTLYCTYE